MLLGRSAGSPYENTDLKALTSLLKAFAGESDDLDMTCFGHLAEVPVELQDSRRRIMLDWKTSKAGQIQDQIAYPDPFTLRNVPPQPALRALSALRLPDTVLFQKTVSPERPFPTGLEVLAILESPSALPASDREALCPVIEKSRDLFEGSSLYQQYLTCLRTLFAEPDKAAPAFMKSEAWRLKSRQTALAGWAQMRHTWALQAKQSVTYLSSGEDHPPGFVEPNSEFGSTN